MRIKDLAATRVRYGYRRIHVLLRREGWQINHKKTQRIYRELGLQLRNKTPKRKVKAKLREDRVPATAPNECWSMDFLSDQLFDGRKIRVLSIVDNFTRLSPALDVRFSYRGSDVVETLERIAAQYGRPKRIRVDQGPEFISKDLDLWAYQHDVVLDFSRPGKPTDTDVVEKPFQAGAGIFFSERDLARGLVRHRAVKSAYASSAFSTRTRSAARFSGML